MKKLTLGIITGAASLLLACSGADTTSENANTDKASESMEERTEVSTADIKLDQSAVMWKGTMIGVYSHEGTLSFTSGSIETSGDQITGGSFAVDMTSMNPTDENYNVEEDKTPENLVGHLSSPEFFDVATYPTASFKISGSEGNSIMGEMTIRGITNEETVENIMYDASSNTWTGTMTIDRKKYDVSWDSSMKEMVLDDNLELTVNITL